METKKHEKQSVLRLQGFLFNLSLTLVLLLVLLAFEWKRPIAVYPDDFKLSDEIFDPIVEIPITQHLTPPPPKIVNPRIIEVKNDRPIDEIPELIVDQNELIETEIISLSLPEEKIDVIHDFVETPATFPGGLDAFYKFVSDEIDYPALAIRTGTEGKVYVQFVIEKDGTVTQVEVMRGIGAGCDEETIRVLSKSPKFLPGRINGQPVKVRMRLPIYFKLQN